jgi:hypothetical protein
MLRRLTKIAAFGVTDRQQESFIACRGRILCHLTKIAAFGFAKRWQENKQGAPPLDPAALPTAF